MKSENKNNDMEVEIDHLFSEEEDEKHKKSSKKPEKKK